MGAKNSTESNSPNVSVAPQAVTATLNGNGVDHAGFRACEVIIALGVFGGTTPQATIQIQDSPDNVTFTAVPAASLGGGGAIPTITPANANAVVRRAYLGLQRYVRVAVTAISGTSPSLPMCAIVDLNDASRQPTAASAV